MDKRELVARKKIIAASRRLFLEHGYAGVSTAMLAKEASTSKATLYKYFKDMNDVLGEVLKQEEMRIEQGVNVLFNTNNEFIENLRLFSVNLLNFLNDPDIAKIDAMLAEHGRASPQMAKYYYLASYGTSVSLIKNMFERAESLGFIHCPIETENYAETFLSALEGFGFTRARFGIEDKPYAAPDDRAEKILQLIITPHLIQTD